MKEILHKWHHLKNKGNITCLTLVFHAAEPDIQPSLNKDGSVRDNK